jgi:hypothetical protein
MAITRMARYIALVVLTIFAMVALLPAATFASVKGRRNTAIGLGAISIYNLARGKTGTGLLFGAGAGYAYKRYANQRDKRKHRRHYTSSYYKKTHKAYAHR